MIVTQGRANLMQKLTRFFDNSKEFHLKYVDSFKPGMSMEEFNKLRLSLLNIISESLSEFFSNDRKIHLVVKYLQIGFAIWSKMLDSQEQLREIISHLFFASCFIVTKLESPELFKRLKSWICENNYNLTLIYKAEKAILNYTGWDIPLDSAKEVYNTVLSAIISDPEKREEYQELCESVSLWILFSISEYSIFKKYNDFIISIGCILISVFIKGDDVFKQRLKDLIEKIGVPSEEVERCSQDVSLLIQLQKEQIKTEEDNEKTITRINSRNSICDSSEDFQYTNEEHVLIHTGQETERQEPKRSLLRRKRRKSKVIPKKDKLAMSVNTINEKKPFD